MANPLGTYSVVLGSVVIVVITIGPLLHSNYYFTGRAIPKPDGNTQLCDNSW